jgi:hypothetical protein
LALNFEHDWRSSIGGGASEIEVGQRPRTVLAREIDQLGAHCTEAFEIADDLV